MNETSETIGGDLSLTGLFRWAVALFKAPRAFYGGLQKSGGYLSPVLFLAFWGFVSSLITFGVGFVRPGAASGALSVRVLAVIASPFISILGGFLLGAILFVIWHLMGSRANFEASFRIWAFTSPLWAAGSLLGLVPYLSLLVTAVSLYFIVLASEECHGLPAGRSWLVWGFIFGFFLLLGLVGLVARQMAGGALPRRMPVSLPASRMEAP